MISLWQTVMKIIVINDLTVFFGHGSKNVRDLFFHTKEESWKNSYSLYSNLGETISSPPLKLVTWQKHLGLCKCKSEQRLLCSRIIFRNLSRQPICKVWSIHITLLHQKGHFCSSNRRAMHKQCKGCGKNSLCRLALSSFILQSSNRKLKVNYDYCYLK